MSICSSKKIAHKIKQEEAGSLISSVVGNIAGNWATCEITGRDSFTNLIRFERSLNHQPTVFFGCED